MKKFLLATAVIGATLLGGCAQLGIGTSGPITISQVQGAAVAVCSFLPTAGSVAALLTVNPAATTAEAIAALICAAVVPNTKAAAAGAAPSEPVIKGVYVQGSFVK